MEFVKEYFPILLPLIILELALMLYSLRHVLTHDKYRFGSKTLWLIIVVFIQIIGPILYLAIGKENE